jgi:hypothetical protein
MPAVEQDFEDPDTSLLHPADPDDRALLGRFATDKAGDPPHRRITTTGG